MKIYQLMFIAVALVSFIGCGGNNSGGNVAVVTQNAISPTDTLKNFIEASKKKDVETIKKSISKNSLLLAEKIAKGQKVTVDELFSRDNPMSPNELPEIRNEKIEGETASVEIKDQTGEYDTIPFIKEDDAWKIAFDKYQQATMEKARQAMNTNQANGNAKTGDKKQTPAPANKPKANK